MQRGSGECRPATDEHAPDVVQMPLTTEWLPKPDHLSAEGSNAGPINRSLPPRVCCHVRVLVLNHAAAAAAAGLSKSAAVGLLSAIVAAAPGVVECRERK